MAETPVRRARIGEEWDDAEQLAEALAKVTGQRIGIAEYVRRALATENLRVREIVEAEEIPAGVGIIVTRDGLDIGGGRILTRPGAYRIAGTDQLIRISDPTADIPPELTFTEEDYTR